MLKFNAFFINNLIRNELSGNENPYKNILDYKIVLLDINKNWNKLNCYKNV